MEEDWRSKELYDASLQELIINLTSDDQNKWNNNDSEKDIS